MMFSQPSSPILKARRQRRRLYSKVLCVVLGILSTIWFIRIAYLEQGSQLSDARGLSSYNTGGHSSASQREAGQNPPLALSNVTTHAHDSGPLSYHSHQATINIPTLAAIVPITPRSLLDLEATLCALLRSPGPLTEVILLTPRQHHSSTRRVVQSILSMDENVDTEMCLRIWPPSMEEGHAVLRAARDATTDWVLLLDEDGLANLSATILDKLLLRTRPTVVAPVGVRGLDYYLDGVTCVSSPGSSAAFLVPPMVLPTAAIPPYIAAVSETDVWSTVGKSLSRSGFNVSGGLGTGTIPSDNPRRQDWCSRYVPKGPDGSPVPVYGLVTSAAAQSDDAATATAETIRQVEGASKGSFLFSARSEDLRYLFPLACRLLANGHSASVLVQDMAENLLRAPCNVSVLSSLVSPSTVNTGRSFSQALLASGVFKNADIVISTLVSKNLLSEFPHAVMVHIPPEDLPYIDWMTAIGLEEWKRWHVPEIQLSVITNDRPESLSRLLNSLTNARYFGDKLTLRINVEQTADPETLRMVDAYSWAHGAVVLHHRVTHGGLLTAVVESWYPHGNDSYALILEDDVELSPLFYAYMKLSLLRYRYGKPENRSPHLFGISLYQQKNLELRPEGRHPFNARSVFEDAGLPEPTSPYLSQIACSWGALYFPEHWREFHAYLIARMSETVWPLRQTVVPDVRSNRWTRSWKKYFIELVYLRGYVMLYPNYADYASLSTNHLEVGSHVKDVPIEVYQRKKKLFHLPLMPLPPVDGATRPPPTGLLELPDGRLPPWNDLPVLDLLGEIATQETISKRGGDRRAELTGCDEPALQAHDVQDLLCTQ